MENETSGEASQGGWASVDEWSHGPWSPDLEGGREGGKKSVPLWEEGEHVRENTSLNLPSQGETWSCPHWTSYH